MARTIRLEYAGACYHVINRGNYRRDLFRSPGAAAAFERTLDETCRSFGWRIHAYVIMRNHFHLALETPEPNLSLGMKWLQGTWVARYNRLRRIQGRPFQGRFKALHVEPGLALAQVAHYLHLNPLRAKAVTAAKLAGYRWSSLAAFPRSDRPGWLVADTVLRESGGLSDTARGWAKYVAYLQVLAEEDPQKRDALFGPLSRGWCVGSEDFRQELAAREMKNREPGKRTPFAGMEPGEWQQERASGWERALLAASRTLAIDLHQLSTQKSDARKVKLAAYLKQSHGAANGWIADRLQMGQPASVSKFVARFRAAGGFSKKEAAALSRVKK